MQESTAAEISKSVTEQDGTSWVMNETGVHWVCAGDISVDGDKEKIVINAAGGVTITLDKSGVLDIVTTGNCNMTYGGNLDIGVSGTTTLTSSGNITMTAPAINLN